MVKVLPLRKSGLVTGLVTVMKMLDETSQVMEYSQKLEKKTRLYETTSKELRADNKRLQQLDLVKDDFLSTSLPFGQLMVTIDRDRIIQVMINLLSNAATYGQSSGAKVNVDLTHDQQTLTVCVADNGPGIGLAICKGIIDHHKGGILVESSPNQGSKFYFTLPLW